MSDMANEELLDANISLRRDLQTSWEEKARLREENERLRRIEEAARPFNAPQFPGYAAWIALRAALAEEKLTPSQELMYAEDGYDEPTEEKP